jgi:hypothetical protein
MINTGDLMISYVRVYIIAGLTLLSFNAESQNYRLEKAWETEPVFSTPESAVFDANRDHIYISNFNTFPRDLESADIEFIPELNLIVIPTFDYNRVIAYRIKE